MIKIAHVIYSFGIGGLEKGITTLINHGSDDIVHVIISLCGNKDSETLLRRSTCIICLDKQGGNSLRFIWDLARVIRSVRPDVVCTRNWGGLDGNTERPVTVTLVTRKTYILTENAMPGKILQWQIRKASGHAADSGSWMMCLHSIK